MAPYTRAAAASGRRVVWGRTEVLPSQPREATGLTKSDVLIWRHHCAPSSIPNFHCIFLLAAISSFCGKRAAAMHVLSGVASDTAGALMEPVLPLRKEGQRETRHRVARH